MFLAHAYGITDLNNYDKLSLLNCSRIERLEYTFNRREITFHLGGIVAHYPYKFKAKNGKVLGVSMDQIIGRVEGHQEKMNDTVIVPISDEVNGDKFYLNKLNAAYPDWVFPLDNVEMMMIEVNGGEPFNLMTDEVPAIDSWSLDMTVDVADGVMATMECIFKESCREKLVSVLTTLKPFVVK